MSEAQSFQFKNFAPGPPIKKKEKSDRYNFNPANKSHAYFLL